MLEQVEVEVEEEEFSTQRRVGRMSCGFEGNEKAAQELMETGRN
jgi:hypothetical protein